MATIAIDFDFTLVSGDKALDGAREAVNTLREKGHKIVIHSCNGAKWIEQTLNNNDIRYDYLWDDKGKPIADIYIDDKGFRFTDWTRDLPVILDLLKGFDNRKWKEYK